MQSRDDVFVLASEALQTLVKFFQISSEVSLPLATHVTVTLAHSIAAGAFVANVRVLKLAAVSSLHQLRSAPVLCYVTEEVGASTVRARSATSWT